MSFDTCYSVPGSRGLIMIVFHCSLGPRIVVNVNASFQAPNAELFFFVDFIGILLLMALRYGAFGPVGAVGVFGAIIVFFSFFTFYFLIAVANAWFRKL